MEVLEFRWLGKTAGERCYLINYCYVLYRCQYQEHDFHRAWVFTKVYPRKGFGALRIQSLMRRKERID